MSGAPCRYVRVRERCEALVSLLSMHPEHRGPVADGLRALAEDLEDNQIDPCSEAECGCCQTEPHTAMVAAATTMMLAADRLHEEGDPRGATVERRAYGVLRDDLKLQGWSAALPRVGKS